MNPPPSDAVPRQVLARLRLVCLELPEVVEESAWEGVRWCVRGKNFAHVLAIEGGRPEAYARAAGTAGPAIVLTFRLSAQACKAERFRRAPFFRPVWFANIAGLACWLGPFVLVPQAAAVVALWGASAFEMPRERWTVIGMGIASVVLPLALELLRLVPPSWELSSGNLVLLSRAVRLSPEWTLPALVWASVTFTILPGVAIGNLRKRLGAAERQLFMQSWQLKQLLR